MDDLISVIVPIYNGERYMHRLMRCILEQTYGALEIILIDDGSKDNSFNVCSDYEKLDSRVRVYTNENHGVSYSRNWGIENARGKYLVFIDCDDYIHKDYVLLLYKNLRQTGAQLSACQIALQCNFNETLAECECITIENRIEIDEFAYGKFKGYLWNKMYVTDIIKLNNLRLDEKLAVCEDLKFNFQYLKLCSKIVYTNGALYFYNEHEGSSSHNMKNKRWFSIIEAYRYLITENGQSENVINEIYYNYLLILYEAKYRQKKFFREDRELSLCINKEIAIVQCAKEGMILSKKEKLRLHIYDKLFWVVVAVRGFKIKRRGIYEDFDNSAGI